MKYIIDLYVRNKKPWMNKYDFKEINTGTNRYYTVKVEKEDRKEILRKARWKGIRFRCYEERWERSSDYRRKFLKENQEPFHCRYCNKNIKERDMVVDHIIPIAKVKKNANHARMWLGFKGISDVNDLRNLAPSCRRCNEAKSDKMGIWIIKAWLGKYDLYWALKPIVQICFLILVIYMLYKNNGFEALKQLILFKF